MAQTMPDASFGPVLVVTAHSARFCGGSGHSGRGSGRGDGGCDGDGGGGCCRRVVVVVVVEGWSGGGSWLVVVTGYCHM
jgi:hypothetical protein